MWSTTGRVRPATDEQIRRILEWQRTRKTIKQVALENGVSRGTIEYVIRTGGFYKHHLGRAPEPQLIKSGSIRTQDARKRQAPKIKLIKPNSKP